MVTINWEEESYKDWLVFKHVLGWEVVSKGEHPELGIEPIEKPYWTVADVNSNAKVEYELKRVPRVTRDLDAAMAYVVLPLKKKMPKQGNMMDRTFNLRAYGDDTWAATFYTHPKTLDANATGRSASPAEAICIAALRAVGVEVK